MNEDKMFSNEDELEDWLVNGRGVDTEKAGEAAKKLFPEGFDRASTLLGISSIELNQVGLSIPLSQLLSNRLSQQTQYTKILERIGEKQDRIGEKQDRIEEEIKDVKTRLDGRASVEMPMSKATINFTSSLLSDLKIKHEIRTINTETGGQGKMVQYEWGENEKEEDGQPNCQRILEGEILPLELDHDPLGMFDIRNYTLPALKAGTRKSRGCSDLALGPQESMDYASRLAKDLMLCYTVALIELKTSQADLNPNQLLLQLISLAMISRNRQGVVVLGTDCASTWRLLHFSEYNTIIEQPYEHGSKCLADFKTLLLESTTRKEKNDVPPNLASVDDVDDNDFNIQEFGLEETPWDKAVAREAKLQRLANALESLYGEPVEVPFWAKASATCSFNDM